MKFTDLRSRGSLGSKRGGYGVDTDVLHTCSHGSSLSLFQEEAGCAGPCRRVSPHSSTLSASTALGYYRSSVHAPRNCLSWPEEGRQMHTEHTEPATSVDPPCCLCLAKA